MYFNDHNPPHFYAKSGADLALEFLKGLHDKQSKQMPVVQLL